jgi:amino acid permease
LKPFVIKNLVAELSWTCSIYFLFPLQFTQVRALSETHLLRHEKSGWIRIGWRASLIVICVSIANHFGNFGLVYGLIGALGGSLVSFVLPLMFYLYIAEREVSNARWIGHVVLLFVAASCMLVATGVSVFELTAQPRV